MCARALVSTLLGFAFLTAGSLPASALTVTFTTFGSCTGPPCSVTLSTSADTLTFDQSLLGEPGPGVWSASGTIKETKTSNGLFLTLTDALVQDLLPSIQGPQLAGGIEILSGNTIGPAASGRGFASLNGEYLHPGGRINDAILTNLAALHTSGGDVILGIANGGEVMGVPSPSPFLASDSRFIAPVPQAPLLLTLNFDLGPGDGFSLPGSADGGVTIAEPATLTLLGLGAMSLGLLSRKRRAKG